MRRASEEARWVVTEERFERRGHDVSEFIFFDAIPDVEKENASRSEHSTCLGKRFPLFGEKHDSELAYDSVKSSVWKGQPHGIRLTPFHRALGAERGSLVQHRLIQI